MNGNQIIEKLSVRLRDTGGFERLHDSADLRFQGISRGAWALFALMIKRSLVDHSVVLVVPGVKTQETVWEDLSTWISLCEQPQVATLYYPAWEVLPHEGKLPHSDVISERLETLTFLNANRDGKGQGASIMVTTPVALMQKTLPSEYLIAHSRNLKAGDTVDPLDLVEWLEDQGYEPESQVNQKGDMSLRGGILDVFPLTSPWPVRLEFFGDELDSLRTFDPASQISRDKLEEVVLPPAGELGILRRFQTGHVREKDRNEAFVGVTLKDYLPEKTFFILCDPDQLRMNAIEYESLTREDHAYFLNTEQLDQLWRHPDHLCIELHEDSVSSNTDSEPVMTGLECSSLEAFRPVSGAMPEPQVAETQRREFFHQLHRWIRQGFEVHAFCPKEGEITRFKEIWDEYGLSRHRPGSETDQGLFVHQGALAAGFVCHEAGLVVISDSEIFGRHRQQRPRRLKSHHAAATRSHLDINFTDLEDGDFVVHIQYGIGIYRGLGHLPLGQGTRGQAPSPARTDRGEECLILEYAPSDRDQTPPRLYVPVSESHLVSKYVGAGKARPSLNTLSGRRWSRTRESAEEAVKDLAGELLTLQARRDALQGFAFDVDTPWQREFEASFLYEETPDQLKAIEHSKQDMESPQPMDRLICGDVGFGKTEVAIRAAFKAVMNGKQVAVLVPTTVLAQQHYNLFRERMAGFPVRIELLSRFRSRPRQRQCVMELGQGSVDIVIGTHRLVQKDVRFKNLGLVVIDEEQRFGVLHKEKLKQMRTMVDVLTLSATPIPRTLYLALTGARDMSTIETPPQDRLPIETIVASYDERIIRDAVKREMNRQGQVFFLHNRVNTIYVMAEKLKHLIPEARVLVGHGQMDSDDLEEVMTSFVNGDADVLLSTTIIESGVDIPNANTIIIDRADRFGLSQLYQLRGRVGRYKHQAYAYLLLPRHASLLADARKRISAIRQYSTLGSGFKVALRDLEIRGAGNLLGPEQSGHITAVGFELYCQLLKQSVARLKGEKVETRLEVRVRLDFLYLSPDENVETSVAGERIKAEPAYIPVSYIEDTKLRISLYRKLAQVNNRELLDHFAVELRDRFGKPPAAVKRLLDLRGLRLLAQERGVESLESKDEKLMLTRGGDYIMAGGRFPRLKGKTADSRLKEIRRLLLSLQVR